ncbi:MAG: hypothetical protein HLUCCA08_02685 [Rhodobacteraceae bacterium HLUCCA08]|nr:MAG: hypothetical protein HLUCCA08_02685 [Rhodobacteraceae bacterium HLUCCA08]
MTRHIVDHPKDRGDGARARAYLRIERRVTPDPATRSLQRRARKSEAPVLREFLRIERDSQS